MAKSNAPLNLISVNVADEIIRELTNDLQEIAISSNWPKEVSTNLSVKNMAGVVYVDYPEELSNIVADLEYGTETSSPSAVIRKFKAKNKDKIASLVADEYGEWIIKTGGGVF